MGQAKQRGSQAERVQQARARKEALRPEKIICNNCKEGITDIHEMDTRNLYGIEAAFAGQCRCGRVTFAMKGSPEAVAAATEALQSVLQSSPQVGHQLVPNKE